MFEPEAYLASGNANYPSKDPEASNGYAVVFKNGNNAGGIFCGSRNTSAPAGDYEAVVRCKVSRIGIAEV